MAERVEGFRGRPVGDLVLRGRKEPIRAFAPLSAERFADPATQDCLRAFALLEAGDPGALAAHVGRQADDRLASFHLKRPLNRARGARIELE